MFLSLSNFNVGFKLSFVCQNPPHLDTGWSNPYSKDPACNLYNACSGISGFCICVSFITSLNVLFIKLISFDERGREYKAAKCISTSCPSLSPCEPKNKFVIVLFTKEFKSIAYTLAAKEPFINISDLLGVPFVKRHVNMSHLFIGILSSLTNAASEFA